MGSSAGSGREDISVPHSGHIATLLGRNLSETDIPLAAGGGRVYAFGYVELKHGIVSETPLFTEPALLQGMNN